MNEQIDQTKVKLQIGLVEGKGKERAGYRDKVQSSPLKLNYTNKDFKKVQINQMTKNTKILTNISFSWNVNFSLNTTAKHPTSIQTNRINWYKIQVLPLTDAITNNFPSKLSALRGRNDLRIHGLNTNL